MRPFSPPERNKDPGQTAWRRGLVRAHAVAPSLVMAALWAALAAMGGWGLWAAASLLLHLGPLQVHGIEVRGLERTNRETLLASAALGLHQPLLTVNLRRSVAAIEALPWVKRATIRRQLPDKLRIEVEEHQGKAAAMLGELWLVNPNGEPFKRFRSADRLVLPVVTGIRAQPVAECPLMEQPALTAKLREALDLLDAMVEVRDDLYNVDELHWDADLGWSSVVLLGRAYARPGAPRPTTEVHLGHEPKERLGVLTHVLAQLADRHQVPQVIWASHARQEGRVQVALAPATQALAPPGFVARAKANVPPRAGAAARKKAPPGKLAAPASERTQTQRP